MAPLARRHFSLLGEFRCPGRVRPMTRACAILTTGLLLASMRPAAVASTELEIGEPFPDLVLPALEDGRPRSLAEFRGKKLILYIFASW